MSTSHLDPIPGLFVRFLIRTEPSIEANLALDEALLVAAEERGTGAVVRVWEPEALAVVLGASSRMMDDVEVDLCRDEGVAIARRSSGGGTVVVGPGTFNVTVVLPADAAPGLGAVDTSQKFVLERVAAALRERDRPVTVQGLGDLTLDNRKFAGSAQRRLRRHLFVHFSVLNDFPLERISRYTRLPARQPAYRVNRPHATFLTNLSLPRDELIAAVRGAWLPPEQVDWPIEVPENLVADLLSSRFSDPRWVERL